MKMRKLIIGILLISTMFCANAQDKSKALVMLQQCLNHSDSITTMRYIGIMDEEKKDMYESVEIGLEFI